jgi:hypothetical protein
MNIWVFQLSELPFHLDIVAFWVIMLSLGLGTAFGIRALSDAVSHTDRITATAGTREAPAAIRLDAAHEVKPAPAPTPALVSEPDFERRAA